MQKPDSLVAVVPPTIPVADGGLATKSLGRKRLVVYASLEDFVSEGV